MPRSYDLDFINDRGREDDFQSRRRSPNRNGNSFSRGRGNFRGPTDEFREDRRRDFPDRGSNQFRGRGRDNYNRETFNRDRDNLYRNGRGGGGGDYHMDGGDRHRDYRRHRSRSPDKLRRRMGNDIPRSKPGPRDRRHRS